MFLKFFVMNLDFANVCQSLRAAAGVILDDLLLPPLLLDSAAVGDVLVSWATRKCCEKYLIVSEHLEHDCSYQPM